MSYYILSVPVSVGLSTVRGLTVLLRESGPGWWECDVVEPVAAACTSGVYLSAEAAVEALDRHLRALDVALATDRPRARGAAVLRGSPERPRQPWTEAEDRAVMAREVPDYTLAHLLGRTRAAVAVRRCVLKRREEVTA